MNINKISFCGNIGEVRQQPKKHIQTAKNPSQDTFVKTDKDVHAQRREARRKRERRRQGGAFALGAVMALMGNMALGQANKVPNVVTVPYSSYVSVEELADTYGSSPEAIIDYNDIDNIAYVPSEVKIPQTYDYIQTKIDSLQDKLFDEDLSEKKRADIETQISLLEIKKEYQENIAVAYTDGKYAYFYITGAKDDAPQEIQDKYSYGINVEEFKNIFDIKDGAIKDNNDINYTWGHHPEYGGYKDFTTAYLYKGQTVKVPLKDIKTDKINFDY